MTHIPENVKQFTKEVTELARKHDIGSYSMTLGPSFLPGVETHPQVRASWTQGRHGANGSIVLQMEVKETVKEEHNFKESSK